LWATPDAPIGKADRSTVSSGASRLLELEDDTRIWPGHDYGNRPNSTMGHEKKEHPYITDFILDP